MRRALVSLAVVTPFGVALAGDGEQAADRVHGRVVRVEDVARHREVRVPAGKFLMGVDPDGVQAAKNQCDALFPASTGITQGGVTVDFCGEYYESLSKMDQRDVYLDAYMIDRHEASVREYRSCVAGGACTLDPLIAGDERYIRDEWPMVNVTWDEAQAFCRWRGGRLPTEAEWERAARGDDPAAIWPWGEREQPKDFNHGQARTHAMREIERVKQITPLNFFGDPDESDGNALLAPMGSYVWGESPYGTRDQAGNVAEWTADAFIETDKIRGLQGLPSTNPVRDAVSHTGPRVVRGGSWRQPTFVAKSNLRDPFNGNYDANRRFSHIGFRCARGVPHHQPFWREREKPRGD
ncbi:MAG: formylglycine-generating enzyme family protein [Myxococcota bacterium]|nr:formylglycine-generating enzyme family protein [Myxococcota bacterium]